MKRVIDVIRWSRLNLAFMLAAFLITGALVALAPETMLRVFGGLARFYETLGARGAASFSSDAEMFTHILQRNAVAAAAYFLVGIVLQAPLAAVFGGTFYGFVAFLAPFTIGKPFAPNDWILIAVEALALVISASLSSAIASELYGVASSLGGWWDYFRKSWRSVTMKPVLPAREVLSRWAWPFAIGVVVIAGILLFVAWFETYGY